MAKGLPPGVHRKIAKGRVYFYFDTGARRNGRPVLKRLPDIRAPEFGAAYAAAMAAKSRVRSATRSALTVAEMWNQFQRSREFARKADNTQRAYLIYGATIVKALGMAPAEDLTRSDVLKLRRTIEDRPGAANMVVSVIAALYTWGRKQELVTVRPTAEIDQFESEDYEPWPEHLIEAALADPDPIIRTGVALLYFTAQRIGDACRIRWSDIREGVIYVRQQKTKIELEIPVHVDLRAALPAPAGIGSRNGPRRAALRSCRTVCARTPSTRFWKPAARRLRRQRYRGNRCK